MVINSGEEIRVNTKTAGEQGGQDVAALSNGTWVVTWNSANGSGQQVFEADGASVGSEKPFNTAPNSSSANQNVFALPDGGWLATWKASYLDEGSSHFFPYDRIYQQRYAADGSAVGSVSAVNLNAASSFDDYQVTVLPNGGWVVTWLSYWEQEELDATIVFQRVYDADGVPLSGPSRVTASLDHLNRDAGVTTLSNGGWVVSWISKGHDGSEYGIYQQAYTANGVRVGTETKVNTFTTGDQTAPEVAGLANGRWVVTWSSHGQDGAGSGIYQQVYAADGTPVGGEVKVNTFTNGDQSDAGVTELSDGTWLVTWTSAGQDGSGTGVYHQRYGSNGVAMGDETRVNTNTNGDQSAAKVTVLSDGSWVITWQSNGQDGSGQGIYQQVYAVDGTKVGDEMRVNTYTLGEQWDIKVKALSSGDWIVTWTSSNQDGSGSGVYQRFFSLSEATSGVIEGTAGGEYLDGGDGNDTIYGYAGNDVLNGGLGENILIGGIGNDTYVLGAGDDTVNDESGIDTITTTISRSLAAYVGIENLTLLGTANIHGVGDALDNVITGNAGNNLLDGGEGQDKLIGGQGNDTYALGSGYDTVVDASGNDMITTTASRSLAAYAGIENLTLLGTANIHGLGDALANVITGNAGHNLLDGGAGHDTLIGGLGNDIYVLGSENDTVIDAGGNDLITSTISRSLLNYTTIDRLTLLGTANLQGTGNALDNTITGNAGHNLLDGGKGQDTLIGGIGNDIYVLGNESDSVVDTGGNDLITSTISRSLLNYTSIERLTLLGSSNVNGAGNGLSNTITGNTGNNVLSGGGGNDNLMGGGGNDTLYGGIGKDTLTGGSGSDVFVFNTTLNATTNVERITDFSVTQDTIYLENSIFKSLGAAGLLSPEIFDRNSSGLALEANDRLIYETDTGELYYDSNGNKAGGSVLIALLSPDLKLTYQDFVVI